MTIGRLFQILDNGHRGWNGEGCAAAFEKVYGKSPSAVEKDLGAYYRSGALKVAVFDTRFEKIGGLASRVRGRIHSRPAPGTHSRCQRTCRRSGQPSRTPGKQFPNRWEAHDALAQVHWRRGRLEQARDELRQAVRLKPSAWSPWWDYARLAQNEPGERNEVLAALREVVRLNPKNLDAQLLLGHHLVTMTA